MGVGFVFGGCCKKKVDMRGLVRADWAHTIVLVKGTQLGVEGSSSTSGCKQKQSGFGRFDCANRVCESLVFE